MLNKNSVRRVAGLAACLLVLPSAWAMDITIDIKHEELPRASGAEVIVDEVIDARQFGTLTDDHATQVSPNPDDSAFNRQLVGRLPDQDGEPQLLYLADDQTVDSVMAEAVTEALERAGYRTVASSEAYAGDARKVVVEITRFWVWDEEFPGKKTRLYFNGEVEATIRADVPPFAQPTMVGGDIRAQGTRPKKEISWSRTGGRGVEDFVRAVTVLLKFPPACTITE